MRNTLRSTGPGNSPPRVLLMVGMDHAHGRSILEGIADYAGHAGWEHHLEANVGRAAIDRGGVDGMIVEVSDEPTIRALRRTRIPAITVTRERIPDGPPAVLVDNQAVGRLACEHLANLGLKNLGFVPTVDSLSSRQRAEGFAAAAAARRINVRQLHDSLAGNGASLQAWLGDLPTPVGILAANDRVALEVSQACRRIGRTIPDQVALMGVDNEVETCRLADPPLTSFDHGTRRIGYEAAKLLDGWMTTGRRPATVLVQPVGVVARPSTDLLAMDDADVVAALRFIRANADQPLKVRDVLDHVAVSRRALELHFRSGIGRTIHAEIMRVRIERARQLLISSDWTMPHIADACGFAFASQFSFVFKRETGLSPVRFRNQFRYRRDGS